MASLAQLTLDVPQPPAQASEGLAAVLQEAGYTLADGTLPGAAQMMFTAKRTMAYTAREGGAQVTPHGSGSTIELGLDVAPGQASGLMDGRRNRKLVAELEEKLRARLGA